MKLVNQSSFIFSMVKRNCLKKFYCNSANSLPLKSDGKNASVLEEGLNLTTTEQKKKKFIEIEMNFEKRNGNYYIPEIVPDNYWKILIQLNSISDRLKMYKSLKKKENMDKKKKEMQDDLQKQVALMKKVQQNPNHIQYGFNRNCIMFKIRESTKHKFYQNNLCHAVLFGQKIVFDLGFEQIMNLRERISCVDQIKWCHLENRINKEPFHLHFCNANMDGEMIKDLKDILPFLQKQHPVVTLTEKSYLELFPKDKLVYLSPHSEENMKTYSHDDIYIIGGIVDLGGQGPVSLVKAQKENIRTARFPLEEYVRWGSGSKYLTLDQVLKILLTMKDTMDWTKAFSHIPFRKIKHDLF